MRWCPEIRAGTKKLARGGQKLRWCPEIGAGAKKMATAINPNCWCSTAAFSFLFFQSGGKRIDKNPLCGRHLLWMP
ncbi:MAG: hypothetical protein QM296_06745 [Bacillota bacterium]|nr:hypothetical protein [Bacillota bacterium]